MKKKSILILTFAIAIFLSSKYEYANAQILSLNDLLKIYVNKTEATKTLLKSKDPSWVYQGYILDEKCDWWKNGDAILKVSDYGTEDEEVNFISNDKPTLQSIVDDLKKNNMVSQNDKLIYLGQKYAVGIILEGGAYSVRVWSKDYYLKNLK